MTPFDYVCLFMAIPIGLALTELAQGLSLAMRRRGAIAVGWLTPLTVLFMLLVLSMMIENFWSMRGEVPVYMPVIFLGFVFTIIFYVAASFVFPEQFDGEVDLDDWFMRNRLFSLGGTTLLGAGFLLYFLVSRSEAFTRHPALYSVIAPLLLALLLSPIILTIRAKTRQKALVRLAVGLAVYLALIVVQLIS